MASKRKNDEARLAARLREPMGSRKRHHRTHRRILQQPAITPRSAICYPSIMKKQTTTKKPMGLSQNI